MYSALKDIGYTDVTPLPEEPDRYYCLRKGLHSVGYHLHLVKFGSDQWEKHLLFCEYLRTHPDIAQQYYEIKKKLAAKHGSERAAYTEAKTSFIEAVVDQARKRSSM